MLKRWALAVAAVIALSAAGASAATLDQVKKRGMLVCGSNPGLAGFGLPDDKGNWTGLDVDVCRAVAAAIFDDPTKVKFVPLTAKDRFTALQSGEVDMLSRNTTWTLSREASQGLLFTGVDYYDGQGFMVRKKLGISSALELSGASICVQQGTTTELNLADFFRSHSLKYEPVNFATADEAVKAYESGRCDAYTTDSSGLYAERVKTVNPDDHLVLPDIISKEPLGPVVRQGDDQWFDVVKWTLFAMVDAEEAGITSKNVDDFAMVDAKEAGITSKNVDDKAKTSKTVDDKGKTSKTVDDKAKSDNPEVKRMLGSEGTFGESLGLTKDWVYRIVKHVGNYGEMFDRNVGEGSPLKIKRGLNALWSKGGLQYAPPIR